MKLIQMRQRGQITLPFEIRKILGLAEGVCFVAEIKTNYELRCEERSNRITN